MRFLFGIDMTDANSGGRMMDAFIAENGEALVAGTIAAGIVLSVVIRLLRGRKRQKRAPCRGGCACCSKHATGALSGN
jgi:hypothetical protein